MSGTLFLLPTPISASSLNAALPPAVIALAHRVEHFLVEDAKTARLFLKQLGHPKSLRDLSIVEIGHAPPDSDIAAWLAPLRAGADIALLSEAGCPAVADPGATLVAAAHRNGWKVQPLVGPSSIILALMASGLDGQHFRFVGYLPIAADERAAAIRALESKAKDETQIFIETPYRNEQMFDFILENLSPETLLFIGKDLTSQGQQLRSDSVAGWKKAVRPNIHKVPVVFGIYAS